MSQALEKAFHLNVKRFLTKRLQGMVMGAFREVMGAQPVFHTPEEVEIIAGGVTRYMPCGLSDGGMGRTKDGKWISLDDALELAKAERERGHKEASTASDEAWLMLNAFEALLAVHEGTLSCGDMGKWNPDEDEAVCSARAAIARFKGEA